ncbi:histidinol-phosphate transaminase [Clostridium sp. 'deep sea']|uniref:histidinol-phosphate transaminase n=1 Tax=Clostridium sp. 'deep sea' TaxID=2779445 RepID=UPI0018964B65|nr:histidinol-phosphate transaminase [Clostridium sp. 'deep sea']QOR36487.1 histidinol-phosphate transaminase [Clostridium sp. 'deep sea']
MSKNLFRTEISKIAPYVPGKPISEVKKEFNIDKIDKLASNENPLGPSPKALKAIKEAINTVNIYPDAAAMDLRAKLADFYGLTINNVVVGSGGEQLLDFVARTFINPGDEAIMADVTFGLYSSSVTIMGGVPIKVPMIEFKHDFKQFVNAVNENTKLIYVCNPNNPSGNIMTAEEVNYLVDNVSKDIVIVFDEAYYEYAKINQEYPNSLEILKKRENTIILRTFSKVVGLAALRVGYVLTSEHISREMLKIKPVFNVNQLAQVAAIAALDDTEHINKTVQLNYKCMDLMTTYFDSKGYKYMPSNSNFIFVNIGVHSKEVFVELMKLGTIIRPGYLWGCDNWIRVSTGTIEQTKRFINNLQKILK